MRGSLRTPNKTGPLLGICRGMWDIGMVLLGVLSFWGNALVAYSFRYSFNLHRETGLFLLVENMLLLLM